MKFHLIGIGGTGMGALAGLLKQAGHEVRGSDEGVYPPMSGQLRALKVEWFEGFRASNLDWDPDVVVVGNVCSSDHVEVACATERKIRLTSLPKLLGEELIEKKHAIVIAGTHGKTTTSSLMAVLFRDAQRSPSYFIGGVPLQTGKGWSLGEGDDFIVEGDEYDSAFFDKGSKFLHYRPQTAILTSVELDHVDIFQDVDAIHATFAKFVALIPKDGLLLVANESAAARDIASKNARCRVETYAAQEPGVESEGVHWEARNISYLKTGRCQFEIFHDDAIFDRYQTSMTGQHNLANITATVAVAHARGLAKEAIRASISGFAGVARRQQLRGIAQGVQVLDDYGHHPTAIALTLEGLRKRFPGRMIKAIFEPRSATSRRNVFHEEFVQAFNRADSLVVGPLYAPERIPEAERLDPAKLAADAHRAGTSSTYLDSVEKIVANVAEAVRPGDVVVVFSSGSFDGIHQKLLTAIGDAVMSAEPKHLGDTIRLLKSLQMDTEDIHEDTIGQYFVLQNETGIVGTVGLEVFGEDAVLRSLAVDREARGVGYGWMLADTVIAHARFRGVRRIYLITESAGNFFDQKHGFRSVDFSTIPEVVSQSKTFRSQSRASSAMRLDL